MSMPKPDEKSFAISKWAVWEAWRKVKANKGAPGVDGESIQEFEATCGNLYKIWNRIWSGRYFPPPVRAVRSRSRTAARPDARGADTQTGSLRRRVRGIWSHCGAYVSRGLLWVSAEEVGPGRGRGVPGAVLEYDWVIDLDVQKFFDTVPWDLVLRAVSW